MPDELEVKNILNEFICSYEYVDECYWQAFDIQEIDEQQLIEDDTAGYIAGVLLQGSFDDKVDTFEQKMRDNLLITVQNENCEPLREVGALETCCYELRLLTENA